MSDRRLPFYRLPDSTSQSQAARSSVRIATLGVIALAMFAVIFFRLWFLQVLSGEKYLAQANNNRVQDIAVEAPRGEIVDRNGDLLVANRGSWIVQLDPHVIQSRPEAIRALKRLSPAIHVPVHDLYVNYKNSIVHSAVSNPTVATDVTLNDVVTVREQPERFPGVVVAKAFERQYPHGQLAAQIFGYVREVSEQQLKNPHFQGAKPGDRVGQDGLEREYDRFLRGVNGVDRIEVDAARHAKATLKGVPPKPGLNLRLTLDLGVQKAASDAFKLVAGNLPGAFVVLDTRDGSVVALGSEPTFNPAVYSGVLKPSVFRALSSKANGTPLVNRAIDGQYPPGSTFKMVTGIAALQHGWITPGTVVDDGGSMTFGKQKFQNAGHAAYGPVNLQTALKVSSDVYFYDLGVAQWRRRSEAIQREARTLGYGHPTGIDLPGEASGTIPDRKWCRAVYKQSHGALCPDGWLPGYDIQMATGQGDVLVTPLQMAVAYAAVGNGGYVVRPHLGLRVDNAKGQVVQDLPVPARRHVALQPSVRLAMLDGIHAAASEPGGTSADVFAGFPVPIAGKTGTAQRVGQADQSWYMALAPFPNPRYVVAVTVEQGGFGAKTAAPIARLILANLFHVQLKQKVVSGASRTQ